MMIAPRSLLLGISALCFSPSSTAAVSGAVPCLHDVDQVIGGLPHPVPLGIGALLGDHQGGIKTGVTQLRDSRRLEFTDVEGRDVYNPSAPFEAHFQGSPVEVMLGRTEEPHLETGTESLFYVAAGGHWKPLAGAPRLALQDPFFARIGLELVVGGVETFPNPDGSLGYRTVFYRDGGRGIDHLTRFFAGPDGMKDIRLVSLEDGKILVLTRPQGVIGGRGKIGATIIDSLGDLSAHGISSAPLLEGQFADAEWGGANAAYLLKDGKVGVLGHIARFDDQGNRHYYPVAFVYDPRTLLSSPMKILLERSDLPNGLDGRSKRPDLKNVLFSGGLVRHSDGTAILYVGAGDAEVYRVTIHDPFAGL